MPRTTIPPHHCLILIPDDDDYKDYKRCKQEFDRQFDAKHPHVRPKTRPRLSRAKIEAAISTVWSRATKPSGWKELGNDVLDEMKERYGVVYKRKSLTPFLKRWLKENRPYTEVRERLLDDRQLRNVGLVTDVAVTNNGQTDELGWVLCPKPSSEK